MNVEPFVAPQPAPLAVFAHLPERGPRARYFVPTPEGGFQPISWAEHADMIRSLGLWLASRGHCPGERAAIFATNRVEWIATALGLQAAGMVMVPVYPASTADQAAYIVTHCAAKLMFVAGADLVARVLGAWPAFASVDTFVVLDDTQPGVVFGELHARGETLANAAEVERRFVHLGEALRCGENRHCKDPREFERLLAEIELDDPAVMLYTSGTTGPPKGVPLTHRNIGVNTSDWLTCNAPLLPDEPLDLLWLPMSHIYGFGEACIGNILGFTSYLLEPSAVLGRLAELRPNVFMSVPAYWEKLAAEALTAEDPKTALVAATGGRLRFCLSGGAGLSPAVKDLFLASGMLIIEGYGLTECSPTLTLNRPTDFRFDSVGKPLASVELRLADDGEILARGPSVFSGYHRDPEATAAAFDGDGWFHTGDVGRFTEDGFLQITGRKKEILVTAGGKNVAPANIENMLMGDPLVVHALVYGDAKKYLVAGLWLDDAVCRDRIAATGSSVDDLVATVVAAANAKLARFEQIKQFAVMDRPLSVEAGLLTSTLKLRRKHIYAAFKPEFEALYS